MAAIAPSPIVCFLDESATDARDSDQAVVGGIVLNRKDIAEFDASWKSMLARHGAPAGIHMIKLGPKGPYPHLVGEACAALLTEAVRIINTSRIFTFGASTDNRRHEALFSQDLREKYFSVYTMAFMMAVEINRASAARAGYLGDIDYVLDEGNRYRPHVKAMYDIIRVTPDLAQFKVGSLEFCNDSGIPSLQAADIIAWATRRVKAGKPFKDVHEPLEGLFDSCYADSPAPDDVIRGMSQRFALAEQGIDPDLTL
jgi:hypothetical protein